jgi:hypothetical protein
VEVDAAERYLINAISGFWFDRESRQLKAQKINTLHIFIIIYNRNKIKNKLTSYFKNKPKKIRAI